MDFLKTQKKKIFIKREGKNDDLITFSISHSSA